MGFWKCGYSPHCAGPQGSQCAGWVGPTTLLCVYGFCSMLRPVEPFLTDFLTGSYKNLTTEQVTRQVYPVWTYANLLLLIPVFLVTDAVRYKPVIVLQGLTYAMSFLLLLVGTGVRSAQWAFFLYSVGTAAEVGYFSFIYSVVQPSRYQRATSYARGAILLGYAACGLLGQLLVSLAHLQLYYLTVISLVSLCVALLTSLFLPMPKRSLFLEVSLNAQRLGEGGGGGQGAPPNEVGQGSSVWTRRPCAWVQSSGRALKRLAVDCIECYSSATVLLFCIWSALGRCGFYQVAGYVQILWASRQPQQNFTAYNGGVDSFATLSGAVASVAVGHVSLEWDVWGELILGGFTALIAGALFLMDVTDDIWLCYTCFTLIKTLYMLLITICTFQIAKKLNRERFALVFGVNSFVGTLLQSILTGVVINTKSLQLTITSQFFVYASYFSVIALLFTLRGMYTAVKAQQTATTSGSLAERSSDLPELS